MLNSKPAPAPNNRAFYDRISRAYDLIADAGEHEAREAGEAALGVEPGQRVLEIGVGTGASLLHLAAATFPGGRVDGLDISPGMLAVAREKLRRHGLEERVELCEGDARDLPYEDGRFDAAFLSFTLELFSDEDVAAVLAEIRRTLKPGGKLGVVSMALVAEGEPESVLERGYQWMHRHFPHIVDCRPIDVSRTLESAGFKIVQQQCLDMWTMPVAVVVGEKA